MSVFSICCNTGTGTAVKTVPGGALDNHFEASGTASGYEIEKSCRLHIYNTLLCVPCNMRIRKTCLEYW